MSIVHRLNITAKNRTMEGKRPFLAKTAWRDGGICKVSANRTLLGIMASAIGNAARGG